MGKRARRRAMAKRIPFGKIVYYDRPYRFILGGTDKIHYITRMFSSYEEALCHLTEIKLEFKVEDLKYRYFKVCKLLGGYKHKGKNINLHVKIFADPEAELERDRIRWQEFSDRLVRQQRGNGVPVSQTVDSSPGRIMRSLRSATRKHSPPAMGRHRKKALGVPAPASWRTTSGGIQRKGFASLQQFSNSALARAKQTRYR